MDIIDGPYNDTLLGQGFQFYQVYFEVHQKVLELHSIDPLSPLLRFVREPSDPEFFARFGLVDRKERQAITMADATTLFMNFLTALKQECQRLHERATTPRR